jgi:hypothetical protein
MVYFVLELMPNFTIYETALFDSIYVLLTLMRVHIVLNHSERNYGISFIIQYNTKYYFQSFLVGS